MLLYDRIVWFLVCFALSSGRPEFARASLWQRPIDTTEILLLLLLITGQVLQRAFLLAAVANLSQLAGTVC